MSPVVEAELRVVSKELKFALNAFGLFPNKERLRPNFRKMCFFQIHAASSLLHLDLNQWHLPAQFVDGRSVHFHLGQLPAAAGFQVPQCAHLGPRAAHGALCAPRRMAHLGS